MKTNFLTIQNIILLIEFKYFASCSRLTITLHFCRLFGLYLALSVDFALDLDSKMTLDSCSLPPYWPPPLSSSCTSARRAYHELSRSQLP